MVMKVCYFSLQYSVHKMTHALGENNEKISMTKEIYENSVLDDSTEAIEEQEAGLCEDAARNVIGVVTDCLKLNIREKPSKDSRVVTVVTCLDELEIDIGDSNDDWYAVCTATGIEGFCMKKFVAVKQ